MLISRPRDAIVLQGRSVTFICETDGREPVNWIQRPLTSHIHKGIFIAGVTIESVRNKFSIKMDGKELILNTALLSDSGIYTCIDNLGLGEEASAELIVLGKDIIRDQYKNRIFNVNGHNVSLKHIYITTVVFTEFSDK